MPSCPGWTANQLVRHLGGAHRWAAAIVATRAATPPPDDHFRDLSPYVGEDPAVLGDWLVEQATGPADVLRAAGPDATVGTPVPTLGSRAAFHARRMAHETVVHRADAFLALGVPFAVDTRGGRRWRRRMDGARLAAGDVRFPPAPPRAAGPGSRASRRPR